MLSSQFEWNTPKIPDNGVFATTEEWKKYLYEPSYKEYLIEKQKELNEKANTGGTVQTEVCLSAAKKVQIPQHSTFTQHDFRPVRSQVLPQNPAQTHDTKCEIDPVRQQQKKPGPSWKQSTAQTFNKQVNRNEVDLPIATEEKTIKNEHTLYYVPPKKSKPGVATQEGALVQVTQEMESKEDDKKKKKNNDDDKRKKKNNDDDKRKKKNNSTNSRKKQETLKGDKDGSHIKQDVRPEEMIYKGHSLPFPHPSVLTKQEQRVYLQLFNLYTKATPPIPTTEQFKQMSLFKELHKKVLAEQDEFTKYLEENALSFPNDYTYIRQEGKRYVQKRTGWQCKRATGYPQYYVQQDSVSILTPKILQHYAKLQHRNTLLQIGMVPKVLLPKVKVRVNQQYEAINQKFPCAKPELIDLNSWVCSRDPNIKKLLETYDVEIVLSESSLACLIDNHSPSFERQWEVPVKVVSVPGKEKDGVDKRTVFIDKPLPCKSLRRRYQNHTFHKYSLLTYVQQLKHNSCVQLENQSLKKEGKTKEIPHVLEVDPRAPYVEVFSDENEMFESGYVDLDKLETFGRDDSIKAVRLLNKRGSSSESEEEKLQQVDGASDRRGRGRPSGKGRGRNQRGGTGKEVRNVMTKPTPGKRTLRSGRVTVQDVESTDTVITTEERKMANTSSIPETSRSSEKQSHRVTRGRPAKDPPTCVSESDEFDSSLSDVEQREIEKTKHETCRKQTQQLLDDKEIPQIQRSRGRPRKKLLTPEQSIKTDTIRDIASRTDLTSSLLEEQGIEATEMNQPAVHSEAQEASDDTQSDMDALVIDCDSLSSPRIKIRDVLNAPASPETPMSPEILQSPTSRSFTEPKIIPLDAASTCDTNTINMLPQRDIVSIEQSKCAENNIRLTGAMYQRSTQKEEESVTGMVTDGVTGMVTDGVTGMVTDGNKNNSSAKEKSETSIQTLTDDANRNEVNSSADAIGVSSPKRPRLSAQDVPTALNLKALSKSPRTDTRQSSTLDQILQSQEALMQLGRPSEGVSRQHTCQQSQHEQLFEQPTLSEVNPKNTLCGNEDDWKPLENVNNYTRPPHKHNMTYDLWDLKGISVLVRAHIQGILNRNRKEKNDAYVTVSPKMEYQPQFGHEQMTRSEACRAWLSNKLKPNTKHVTVRINAYNSAVMMLETTHDASPLTLFSPNHTTTMLYDVFSKLKSLPAGDYLMGHAPGNTHVHIQKNVSTSVGVYDLHKAYLDLTDSPTETGSAWIPLDYSLRTEYHKSHNRVPGTFEPKDSTRNAEFFHKGAKAKRMKKKYRKKKPQK